MVKKVIWLNIALLCCTYFHLPAAHENTAAHSWNILPSQPSNNTYVYAILLPAFNLFLPKSSVYYTAAVLST